MDIHDKEILENLKRNIELFKEKHSDAIKLKNFIIYPTNNNVDRIIFKVYSQSNNIICVLDRHYATLLALKGNDIDYMYKQAINLYEEHINFKKENTEELDDNKKYIETIINKTLKEHLTKQLFKNAIYPEILVIDDKVLTFVVNIDKYHKLHFINIKDEQTLSAVLIFNTYPIARLYGTSKEDLIEKAHKIVEKHSELLTKYNQKEVCTIKETNKFIEKLIDLTTEYDFKFRQNIEYNDDRTIDYYFSEIEIILNDINDLDNFKKEIYKLLIKYPDMKIRIEIKYFNRDSFNEKIITLAEFNRKDFN